jgi:hypothetical protein
MKVACSSASFARSLEAGELTQLEWLDLAANELEVDGVVFEAQHFPRVDDDYVAQVKKACVDLGLSVGALADDSIFGDGALQAIALAGSLGAPLVVARAPAANDDPNGWNAFVAAAKHAASEGKRANVTIALRDAPQTLVTGIADAKRLVKDVDSAWIRFAPELATGDGEALGPALGKTVIAYHTLRAPSSFAAADDVEATRVIAELRRFRGFVVFERSGDEGARDAFHLALERFAHLRASALSAPGDRPVSF